MKIKIKYSKFNDENGELYVAEAYTQENVYITCVASSTSYGCAREDLVQELKNKVEREPEEVEI